MPDFDQFERLFCLALSSKQPSADIPSISVRIEGLPEVNKVNIVKNLSLKEVEEFLFRAQKTLLSFFDGSVEFDYSPNNKEGKDLLEVHSGQKVELKSGSKMTDANSGLSLVAWALEGSLDELRHILVDPMKERREMFQNLDGVKEIERSKRDTWDRLYRYFQKHLTVGEPAPERLEHYVKCVSVGITTGKDIKECFNSSEMAALPLLLMADWNEGLVVYEKAFLPEERVLIKTVDRTDKRSLVVLEGSGSNRKAILYPNYKNSWKTPQGERVPASNFVESPCFHLWIE